MTDFDETIPPTLAQRTDPLVGTEIDGRWRVLRKIGQGGMATVYAAEQVSIADRAVALKFIHAAHALDPDLTARFRREAASLAAIRHPRVVTVFDLGELEDGRLYIAMEFVEGMTLKRRIPAEGLPVPDVLSLGAKIADALSAAHEAGVLHRDVKPTNVLVRDGTDEVVLMDFGVARLVDSDATAATQAGLFFGTPAYMAPEQAEGGEVTERSDIYALGVVLYEMLSGVVPLRAPTPVGTLARVLHETPRAVREVRADTPEVVESIVMRMLEKDPEARPADMAEVVQQLEAAASVVSREEEAALAQPGPDSSADTSRGDGDARTGLGKWIFAGLATAAVATGAAWLLLERQDAPRTEAPTSKADAPPTKAQPKVSAPPAPAPLDAAARAALQDHLSVGSLFLDRGDYASAITELESALAIDPTSSRAQELLGRAQRARQAEEEILGGGA